MLNKKNKLWFTLIEILIVVSLLAIISIPTLDLAKYLIQINNDYKIEMWYYQDIILYQDKIYDFIKENKEDIDFNSYYYFDFDSNWKYTLYISDEIVKYKTFSNKNLMYITFNEVDWNNDWKYDWIVWKIHLESLLWYKEIENNWLVKEIFYLY